MKERLQIIWLPIALASTIMVVAVYMAVQQDIRLSANDPQIQIAEDLAQKLSDIASTTWSNTLKNENQIDFSTSLAPFEIIYNQNGDVVISTGSIHDAVPVIPAGVLEYTRLHNENRITWQPAPDVRLATVIKHLSGKQEGFVLSGRNLREIENREFNLELILGAVWLISVILTMFIVLGQYLIESKSHNI